MKKVRILFCTSIIATSSPSELLKEHVAKKMRSENGAKVAGEKCRKWAGATPKISGGAAQNFALGRSRPCCSHRRVRIAVNDRVNQARMRTLIMSACKKEKDQMPVLKAPPKQPKNATLQVRIDEDLKYKLDKYAEFLETTGAYVVSEALRLVFNKDAEFKEWIEVQERNAQQAESEHAPMPVGSTDQPVMAASAKLSSTGNKRLSGSRDS